MYFRLLCENGGFAYEIRRFGENDYFGHFVDFGVPLYTKSSQNGPKTPKESCIAKMVIFGYACFLRGFWSIVMTFDDQRYVQNHQNGQNGALGLGKWWFWVSAFYRTREISKTPKFGHFSKNPKMTIFDHFEQNGMAFWPKWSEIGHFRVILLKMAIFWCFWDLSLEEGSLISPSKKETSDMRNGHLCYKCENGS